MARIFISHSSSDNEYAIVLRDWLLANGWDDLFLDLDPEQGIVAGEKWKEALKEAAHRCEAVLALVSPEWLKRDWCRAELASAEMLGKKIFVLLIGSDSADLASSLKDAQYVDFINDPDAYKRLKAGLKRAGLDPTSFPFKEGRRPYPGLPPLEEEDAAIFFGRDAQIVRGLDKLRGLVRSGVERVLFILGASGSGKSSFLRAGLLPRLKLDDTAWLPLPTIRPERAVITGNFGLVEALYRVINETRFKEKLDKDIPRSRAAIEELVTDRDGGLATILDALREAGRVAGSSGEEIPQPTVVIPVDQGEELFNDEGCEENERFIAILKRTLVRDLRLLVIVTMRTDSFHQAQNHPVLSTLPHDTYTLARMPEGSYRTVIEGPAKLVKPPLRIDPELTEALLEDASGQDALALLAFTLRHLYERHQADNALSLEGYEKLGRLRGVIEAAVKEAFVDGAARGELPKEKQAQLALIRIAFIPHLARINAAGEFVRRVATRAEIPAEAHPIIDRFADARLLVKDRRRIGGEDENAQQDTRGGNLENDTTEVIEVAHEALLREWEDLNQALTQEKDFLQDKTRLERDLADWQKASDEKKPGALLTGNKLARAQDWLIRHPEGITDDERQFIQASADADAARRNHELEEARKLAEARREAAEKQMVVTRRTRIGLIAASVLLVAASVGTVVAWQARNEAEEQTEIAEQQAREAKGRQLGVEARTIMAELRGAEAAERGAALAVEGWRQHPTAAAYQAALSAMRQLPISRLAVDARFLDVSFNREGTLLAAVADGETVRLLSAADGSEIMRVEHDAPVSSIAFSEDGSLLATGTANGTGRVIQTVDRDAMTRIDHRGSQVKALKFSPDGSLLAMVSQYSETVRLVRTEDGSEIARVGEGGLLYWVSTVAFSPDGSKLAMTKKNGTVWLAKTKDGSKIARIEHESSVSSLAFSPDGSQLATIGSRSVRLIRTADGSESARLEHRDDFFNRVNFLHVAFSPDGSLIALVSDDLSLRRVRTEDGTEFPSINLSSLSGGKIIEQRNWPIAFSPDGSLLVTANSSAALLVRTKDGAELARVEHSGRVVSVAFSPDGMLLATAGGDMARLIRTKGGEELANVKHDGISSVTFSPDGSKLATAGGGTVRIVPTSDGSEVVRLEHGARAEGNAFSLDGSLLATTSQFGTAHLVRTANGAKAANFQDRGLGPATAIALSPDGSLLATGSRDGTVRLINTEDGVELARIKHRGTVSTVKFSPDGLLVATGDDYGLVRVTRVADGGEVFTTGQAEKIASVAFSPDGSLLALAATGQFRAGYKVTEMDGSPVLSGHWGATYLIPDIAFSPDGILLVTKDRLLRIADGAEVVDFGVRVATVEFIPDSSLVAVGYTDGTARLIGTADGVEVARIEHAREVRAVSFSKGGTLLATASLDGTARVVRTLDGVEVTRVEHGGPVYAVDLSPDESLVATGSGDGTVRLVQIADGTELARIETGSPVFAVEFSPNGSLLAIRSGETVRLIHAIPGRLIELLCETRAGRNLSKEEWRRHIGDPAEWEPTCPIWRTLVDENNRL